MDIQSVLFQIIAVFLDAATLAMVIATIIIVAYAIFLMTQNRTPRWDLILFISLVLLAGGWALQVLPEYYLRSARIGFENAQGEAQTLQSVLRSYMPSLAGTIDDTPQPAPGSSNVGAPTTPARLIQTDDLVFPTAVPLPTPAATPTAVPQPTPAATRAHAVTRITPPIITPQPTPTIFWCADTATGYAPGCVLPTPEHSK
ncbi:MAG: hypothetical protein D6706_06665 [Chloroflexi bacterium]|nr:MAG: hypothetical protein D6706_06665 [Chloroflexota bacterium]